MGGPGLPGVSPFQIIIGFDSVLLPEFHIRKGVSPLITRESAIRISPGWNPRQPIVEGRNASHVICALCGSCPDPFMNKSAGVADKMRFEALRYGLINLPHFYLVRPPAFGVPAAPYIDTIQTLPSKKKCGPRTHHLWAPMGGPGLPGVSPFQIIIWFDPVLLPEFHIRKGVSPLITRESAIRISPGWNPCRPIEDEWNAFQPTPALCSSCLDPFVNKSAAVTDKMRFEPICYCLIDLPHFCLVRHPTFRVVAAPVIYVIGHEITLFGIFFHYI